MTIIVGYKPLGSSRVWLGADTRTTGSGFIYPERRCKLHREDDWLWGVAGADRFHEFRFLVGSSVEKITTFRDQFFAWVKEWTGPATQGTPPYYYELDLIVARRDELWSIAGNGCIWSPDDGFCAIGSGGDFAYGAAYAYGLAPLRSDETAILMVKHTIQAAMKYRQDCGGEVDIESVG
jgi:ATP-dependent protease HslVU (ClpYQ) peptidase subunit